MIPKKEYKPQGMERIKTAHVVTKMVEKALDSALSKRKLARLLGISFPTLQDRLYRDTWTAQDKFILRKEKIIKGKWYDLDNDSDEGLAEGAASFLPDPSIYVPGSGPKKRGPKSKCPPTGL